MKLYSLRIVEEKVQEEITSDSDEQQPMEESHDKSVVMLRSEMDDSD